MKDRNDIEDEIWELLDSEAITSHELLIDFLSAMSTQELSENWEYIKQCRELDKFFKGEDFE